MKAALAGFLFPLLSLHGAEIGCIKEIELPRFAVANRVPEGGTVSAHVYFAGPSNKARVAVKGSHRSLELEVEHHLTEKAKYDESCTGSVEILFTFRVEGEPSYNPFSKITFRPPNHFVISTQLARPTINLIPLPAKKPEL